MTEDDPKPDSKVGGNIISGNTIIRPGIDGISLPQSTGDRVEDNTIIDAGRHGVHVRAPASQPRKAKWFETWWGIALSGVIVTVIGGLILFALTGSTG
ncbi:MAG: hypothetical protein M0D54_05060 [Hyphomonadaceae bacterium JAD_PAG50586_4]|nr:MAG: hypothetical protein M0D54_05060 [Hyphomonadaceae bacterium JAD_PAG50586_4]